MGGLAYIVVKAIAYEQPELLAVWREESQADEHCERLASAYHARTSGLHSYAVWAVPFEAFVTDDPPEPRGRIISTG